MQKLFLDTNIILDFLGERKGFYKPAAKIMTLADKKEIKVYTSPLSIATSYYLLSKYSNKKQALEKMRKFKMLSYISLMNDEVVEKALNAGFKDFKDALQYFTAIASNCEILITRNEKDFKKALLPVMNAESYLQISKER